MSSATEGYSTPGETVQAKVAHHDTIPFTGLDVGPFLAVAVLLVSVGAGLRRLTRQVS